ncbi:MAG: PHP domain-containing protein [Clostridiales bacterium]|nr:PHP domain-containing protein [Clostridiales bacterium]
MILSNPHTHTRYCDGKNTPADMAREAFQRGFISLGFSEHAPQPIDPAWGMADEAGYQAEVRGLQREYAGRMKIWLGVEFERLAECDLSKYDYVVAASHYVDLPGGMIAVDGRLDKLLDALSDHFRGDGVAMAAAYYGAAAEFAAAIRPAIWAHFDLIKKHNVGGALFDAASAGYRRAALQALEKVRASGAALEVNTGGMARGYMDEPYPDLFLLQAWREMGGEVIVGSDCHFAPHLEFGFDAAIALIKRAGYDGAVRLGGGDALLERFSL